MNCPNCNREFPDKMNLKIKFCPMCGSRLFEDGKEYVIQIECVGQRSMGDPNMMVFLDDRELYEVRPGESICFATKAGFHALRFRQKVRNKTITLLVNSSYAIKAYFNSLSGLIETGITKYVDNGADFRINTMSLTEPVMVMENDRKGFDTLLGNDDPDYEFRVTSGFKEGVLSIYDERCEFTADTSMIKEIVYYKNVVGIKKKMGAIDVQCDGNVHKVYSIPKDSYNEVLAFLSNRIKEVKNSTE